MPRERRASRCRTSDHQDRRRRRGSRPSPPRTLAFRKELFLLEIAGAVERNRTKIGFDTELRMSEDVGLQRLGDPESRQLERVWNENHTGLLGLDAPARV